MYTHCTLMYIDVHWCTQAYILLDGKFWFRNNVIKCTTSLLNTKVMKTCTFNFYYIYNRAHACSTTTTTLERGRITGIVYSIKWVNSLMVYAYHVYCLIYVWNKQCLVNTYSGHTHITRLLIWSVTTLF